MYLSEYLEHGLSVVYHYLVDGVINLVVLYAVEGHYLIVIWEFCDDRSCRRNYGLVLSVWAFDEEDTVIIIILYICICKTLEESKVIRKSVGCVSSGALRYDSGILRCDGRIVLSDDAVLLLYGSVIVIDAIVSSMNCVIICDVTDQEIEIIQSTVEEDSKRRSADVVAVVPISVVDAVTDIVVIAPIPVSVVVCRESMDSIAEVVMTSVVEQSCVAMLYETAVHRSHPWL